VDGVTVWAAPTEAAEAADATRLGLSIRSSVGSAVQRNKLRRRVRAIFSAYDPAPGRDVVVQATSEAAGRNFQELSEALGLAFQRAGVKAAR
jgi:ribonuclease P protein component